MDALLTAMALWLAANFGLPPIFDLPNVRFVAPTEIIVFRYRAFTPEKRRQVLATHAAPDSQGNVLAVYDDASRTIPVARRLVWPLPGRAVDPPA